MGGVHRKSRTLKQHPETLENPSLQLRLGLSSQPNEALRLLKKSILSSLSIANAFMQYYAKQCWLRFSKEERDKNRKFCRRKSIPSADETSAQDFTMPNQEKLSPARWVVQRPDQTRKRLRSTKPSDKTQSAPSLYSAMNPGTRRRSPTGLEKCNDNPLIKTGKALPQSPRTSQSA